MQIGILAKSLKAHEQRRCRERGGPVRAFPAASVCPSLVEPLAHFHAAFLRPGAAEASVSLARGAVREAMTGWGQRGCFRCPALEEKATEVSDSLVPSDSLTYIRVTKPATPNIQKRKNYKVKASAVSSLGDTTHNHRWSGEKAAIGPASSAIGIAIPFPTK